MDLFENILSEMFLLTEDAAVNDINNAINNMHPVWIRYDDQQGGSGKNRRYICPVAYGISTAGNPVIRAFQPQGSTKRGAPKWKLFRLDRIKMWRNINSKTFSAEELTGFNEDGDDQISTLFTISPIGNAKTLSKTNKVRGIITPKPILKQDIDGPKQETEPETATSTITNNNDYTANNAIDDILTNVSKSNTKNIDNNNNVGYSENDRDKLEAPETKPITQGDIEIQGEETPAEEEDQSAKMTGDDNPVLQSDIDGETEDNKLSRSFKDMMGRMNNLNKQ